MSGKNKIKIKKNLKLDNGIRCDFWKSFLGTLAGAIVGGVLSIIATKHVTNAQIENVWSQEAISYMSNAENCTDELVAQIKQFGEYILIQEKLDSDTISTKYSQPINIKLRNCRHKFRKLNLVLKKSGCTVMNGDISYDFIDKLKKLFESSVNEPSNYSGRCNRGGDTACKDLGVEMNHIIQNKINPHIENIYKVMENCR